MENRLRLVQQVKNQYHQNQYDMANREQILYGYHEDKKIPEEARASAGSFRLRLFLAGMLFIAVIFCDRLGICPAGMEMNEIFAMLETDYQENLIAFVETISQQDFPDD